MCSQTKTRLHVIVVAYHNNWITENMIFQFIVVKNS